MTAKNKKKRSKKITPQIAVVVRSEHGDYIQVLGDAVLSGKKDKELGIRLGKLGAKHLYLAERVIAQEIPICPDCNLPLIKKQGSWVCACIQEATATTNTPAVGPAKPKKSIPLMTKEESAALMEATGKSCKIKSKRPSNADLTMPLGVSPSQHLKQQREAAQKEQEKDGKSGSE